MNFTGIDVLPVYSEANRFGGLDYELKATAASDATMIVPNYRPSSGMPFSKIADLDSANPHQRLSKLPRNTFAFNPLDLEVKARLINDFIPHGSFGLTGQADLVDSSQKLRVYVQLLKVPGPFKTHFHAGANMVFKGSIKKFAATNGIDCMNT